MTRQMLCVLGLVFGLVFGTVAITAQADTFTWKNVTGDWNVAANWVENAVPDSLDDISTVAQGTMQLPTTAQSVPGQVWVTGTSGVGGTVSVPSSFDGKYTMTGGLFMSGGKLICNFTQVTYSFSPEITFVTGTSSVIEVTGTVSQTLGTKWTGSGSVTKTGSNTASVPADCSGYTGTLSINAGAIALLSTGTTLGGKIIINAGGALTDGNTAKTWTISGGVDLNGGTLRSTGNNGITYTSSSGAFNVLQNSSIVLDGSGTGTRPHIYLDAKLTGSGNLSVTDGTANAGGKSLQLRNAANDYSGRIDLYSRDASNAGSIRVTAAGAEGKASFVLRNTNTRLEFGSGTDALPGGTNWTLSQNNVGGIGTVLIGDGTAARVLTFKGGKTLSPGLSAGTLTVQGSLTLGDATTTGILDIELGGTGAGQYDVLKLLPLSGSPTLTLTNAVLNVSFVSGFTPTIADTFVVVDVSGSNAVSGTFASVNWPSGWTGTWSKTGGDGNDIVLSNLYELKPTIALTNPVSDSVIRGGSGSVGIAVGNTGSGPLNYTLTAVEAVDDLNLTLGAVSPGSGTIAVGGPAQPNTATVGTNASTILGPHTINFTATDPNATNSPLSTEDLLLSPTVTVYDHSLAEFASDDTTLTLDFGVVPQWSSPAALSYAIENVWGNYRVNLGFDTLISATGDTGKFNVVLPTGLILPNGQSSSPYLVSFVNTTVGGAFEAVYTLGFSDRSALNGAQGANAQTLTLTVKGFVQAPIAEPAGLSVIGLLALSLSKGALLGLKRRRK